MTKDEALRLALDVLEYPGPSWVEARQPAITAIKAALEAKDEPVAWMNDSTPSGIFARHIEGAKNFGCTVPLYTTPPQRKPLTVEQPKVRTGNCLRVGVCASEGHKIQPQRTWVGLTDEDISEIVRGTHNTGSFVRAIEAKLKLKNT